MKRVRLLALMGGILALVLGAGVSGSASPDDEEMRWDLVNINFTTGTVSSGGVASARASDGSKITLTGSGEFDTDSRVGSRATGGGTWTTYSPAPAGAVTGTGTYRVTRFVSFAVAPGTLPVPNDDIGSPSLARAGLLTVAVKYSSGEKGVLTVSCHLVGSPNTLFEGITTTKGTAAYWNPELPPAPPANGNRTLFHVLNDNDNDED